MNRNEVLQNWVFCYNPSREAFEAVERDYYNELWNGGDHVLRSSEFKTLQEIIIKTGGDRSKIKKLIK